MVSDEQLRNRLSQFGQEHLLRFWNELKQEERDLLRKDIEEINLAEVTDFFKQANKENENQEKFDSILKPMPADRYGSAAGTNEEKLKLYEKTGLEKISENRVGVLLLAGGQGTRLGVSYPKGMYDVGLPSKKSLFQIQAERILKLQALAEAEFKKKCSITWYIMTSDATMESTQKFFEDRNYFGLDKNNVVMFEQGMLPCFDFDGKILLSDKYAIAKAPDGNGGLYKALKTQNILDDMMNRGVKYLHAYCVDNILVKVADPVFIGYCVTKGADCAAKVVKKVAPEEPIGVVCDLGGKLQVIEYSEISPSAAERRNPDGDLTFSAGNICNHFFTREFLKNVSEKFETQLKLHIAKKKIPHIDENGTQIQPTKPNGVKIEKFVFDVFVFSSNFVVWEVPRVEEFSAIKNPDSVEKDSPSTAKQALYRLHRMYIEKAGGEIVGDGPCEISPLVSYAGEGLDTLCKGKSFNTPVLLSASNESQPQQNGFH